MTKCKRLSTGSGKDRSGGIVVLSGHEIARVMILDRAVSTTSPPRAAVFNYIATTASRQEEEDA